MAKKVTKKVVDLEEKKESLREATSLIGDILKECGGESEEIRPGKNLIQMPDGEKLVLTVVRVEYLAEIVYRDYLRSGEPIPDYVMRALESCRKERGL